MTSCPPPATWSCNTPASTTPTDAKSTRNDILQSTGKDTRRYVVEFEAPSFVVVRGGTSVPMDRLPISTGIKKIGNIHEHPDLVKEG